MDASLFTKMLSDTSVTDLKKLGYKYPQADMKEFVELLGTGFYKTLPLKDFNGGNLSIWKASRRSVCRRPRCC